MSRRTGWTRLKPARLNHEVETSEVETSEVETSEVETSAHEDDRAGRRDA
jgi:hypothetical protein